MLSEAKMGIPGFISCKQTRFVYLQMEVCFTLPINRKLSEKLILVSNGSFEADWDYIKNIPK